MLPEQKENSVILSICKTLLFLSCLILGIFYFPALSLATTVQLQTSQGVVDVVLFDSSAPLTVANFMKYVNSGDFQNSFFHRSIPGFIVQGGGYTYTSVAGLKTISARPPVINEFSPDRSNLRGTLAMAKLGGDPDSATSGWFVNLADNSANLDNQNGGFTVFGQVSEEGMAVIDAIAAMPTVNLGGAFTDLPVNGLHDDGRVYGTDLVMVNSISVVEPDIDRLFNYLEDVYPQHISPPTNISGTAMGYYYRYYPDTNSYVGAANGILYYMGSYSKNEIMSLGDLSEWINLAVQAGY